MFHHSGILFSDVVWDLVVDEDNTMRAVEEVWGGKGMLTVALSSLQISSLIGSDSVAPYFSFCPNSATSPRALFWPWTWPLDVD